MSQGLEGEVPSSAKSTDRRAGIDRRQLTQLRIARVLAARSSARAGYVEVQAMSDAGDPVEMLLPVEGAMTLLNSLHQLSTDDRWFDVD
jgi:hypothetical protein